jgi:hypothetical protein
MTNYVSFCLYGSNPKYTEGAIRNAEIASGIMPNWKPVFYLGSSVSERVENRLRDLGAKIIRVWEEEDPAAMLWRYRAIEIEDSDLVIFRDTDSRLSTRETNLVEDWVASDKDIHIIRDHPDHKSAILGGMWGGKAKLLRPRFPQNIIGEGWGHSSIAYGFDQEVIRLKVYRDYRLSRLIHDGIFVREKGAIRPVAHSSEGAFIGEIFTEEDVPDPFGRKQIIKFYNSRIFRVRTQLGLIRQIVQDFLIDIIRILKFSLARTSDWRGPSGEYSRK